MALKGDRSDSLRLSGRTEVEEGKRSEYRRGREEKMRGKRAAYRIRELPSSIM